MHHIIMRASMIITTVMLLLSSFSSVLVQSFSIEPSPIISSRINLNVDAKIHAFSSFGKSLLKTSYASVCLQMSSTAFNYGQQQAARKNIRLPLLVDIGENDGQRKYDVPLPNAHLPVDLTTASLYALNLDVPLHRSVVQDAISSTKMSDSAPSYGHVVYTPDNSDGLVGSIGCASEILIGAPTNNLEGNLEGDKEDSGPLFVLARGAYRFRVKEIVKSIPYTIAIVDEILDENISDDDSANDEEEEDIYDTLPSNELIKQIFESLNKILESQIEATATPLSPLAKSILEDAPSSTPMVDSIQRRFDAEERIAVFQTFTSSLLDIAPGDSDRAFAVAMIAGELASLPSELRVKMLRTTDGVARLRMVLRELGSILAMDSARKITKSLSLGGGSDGTDIDLDPKSLQEAEDAQKELQVGIPELPQWANQIQKGVRVEYFWSEVEGWCLGTVDEDPVKIMDEIIVTVKFDDDGSIHKLPIRGDDKARWRPVMGESGAFD